MASAGLEKELKCSICLTLYTDPVTLRCGHNFCRACIDQMLDTQEGSGAYSCPECREAFQERPALKRNTTLCNVVENFRSNCGDEGVILCTYCVASPVPAVISGLHCEASLCEKHLKDHSTGPDHILTDPSTPQKNKKRSVHSEILEYYCTEDAACIYSAGEHWRHGVETLDQASEKENLRNVYQELNKKRERTEESVWNLEALRRKAQEKAAGEAERVTALFIDIRRRVDDLEKKVLREISRREKKVSLSLSDVIQKLEIEKDELSRKMRHIEELCNMTDPLTVLQEPDTGDLCDSEEDGGDEATGGHDGGDEDTGGHDGGDEATGGHYGGDDDTGGHDGGDEDTGGHEGGDEHKGGHDGGDEDTGGHDGSDEDTGGHDGGDEATGGHDEDAEGHDGGDEATGGHDGGDEDTAGHDGGDEDTAGHDGGDEATGEHDGGDEDTGGHDGGDEDTGGHDGDWGVELISLISHSLSDIIRGVNVTFYVQDPADILLDVNTAHNDILLSDDLKSLTWTWSIQNYPETAERFHDYFQVMSRRGFSSGRHYWDVEISGSWSWRVGMCYPSIDRRGRQSYVADNTKSWGLFGGPMHHNHYFVIHDDNAFQLPHQISSDRVRVYLDYEAGQLSFYELCEPIRHLHTFTATFTEPLLAALYVGGGAIKISGRNRWKTPL